MTLENKQVKFNHKQSANPIAFKMFDFKNNKCQVTGDGLGSTSPISPNWLSCFIGDGVGTGNGVEARPEVSSEITQLSESESSTKVSGSRSSCLGLIFASPNNSPTCFGESDSLQTNSLDIIRT